MIYRFFADVVVVVHLGFVVWVVLGGLMVLRWRSLLWWHLPAVLWGAAIEFIGFVCPLTPLEVWLREQGGEMAYEGGFIDHYITPLLYPEGLTRGLQIILGFLALLPNIAIYGCLLVRWRRAGAALPRHR
jgi:hypothetical protein